MTLIEISSLRKQFKGRRGAATTAVDGLDLDVPEGGVFAFLGPNGAGKTTTLRCILGLVRPTSGQIHVLGARVPRELPSVIGQIGSLLETPAFHPRFSGRYNLALLGGLARIGNDDVDAILQQVGLSERADDRVSTYSLGMRQRLGIAAALLKDPELVLLDEPTNGLDPAGIADMRQLLRNLAIEGRTVFVSSHLLSEVRLIADRVAIVSRGKCVFSGTMHELLGGNESEQLFLRIDDVRSASAVLADSGFQVREENGTLRIAAAASEATRVGERLASHNLFPLELRAATTDLETVFLRLTGDDAEADP